MWELCEKDRRRTREWVLTLESRTCRMSAADVCEYRSWGQADGWTV